MAWIWQIEALNDEHHKYREGGERSNQVTPSIRSVLSSTDALASLGNRVAPSLTSCFPSPVAFCSRSRSLPFSLHTSKRVSLSLWGIETVNAWGFDVPLLCEPSQSSACACLPSLHHLIILCGGERERERLWNSPSFTPLLHVSISLSTIWNPCSWQTNSKRLYKNHLFSVKLSPAASLLPLFILFFASSAAYSASFKLSLVPNSFEGLSIEGWR